MTRSGRFAGPGRTLRTLTVMALGALILSACSGGNRPSASPTGDPVAGGVLKVTQVSEPRSLDPAALSNNGSSSALLGNALYGMLFAWDFKKNEVNAEGSLAESLVSKDEGRTFLLTLRDGVKFSDGTPFDAEAVQANWKRIQDPATASQDITWALNIKSMKVVDALHLRVELRAPIPTFGSVVATTALTWIAAPDALAKGAANFDKKPIGAGPFVLKKWSRGSKFSFERNDGYLTKGRPYLDGMEVGFTSDSPQRLNQMISGQIDLGIESSYISAAKLKDQGFQVLPAESAGGTNVTFNSERPPFDDVRARQAIILALNKETINQAAYEGKAEVVNTLFRDDSPYHVVDLPAQDKKRAQELFDALAAEGKPLRFTLSTFPTAELRVVAESIQAQLNTFKNVKMEVKVLDFTESSLIIRQRRFEAATSSLLFLDPGTTLYNNLDGKSPANAAGLDDPKMNAALKAGRAAGGEEERKAAFADIQKRFNELFPAFVYVRTFVAATASDKVGGLNLNGYGSVRPELLWLAK